MGSPVVNWLCGWLILLSAGIASGGGTLPVVAVDESYWGGPQVAQSLGWDSRVLKKADDLLATKLGETYFRKYFHFNPAQSTTSEDGSVFYLHYLMLVPDRGLGQKMTSHPTEVSLDLDKDLHVRDARDLEFLPDCRDHKRCDFVHRDRILEMVRREMAKAGGEGRITLDLQFRPRFSWVARFSLPQNRTPECKFKLGGTLFLEFQALSGKMTERKKSCNFPAI